VSEHALLPAFNAASGVTSGRRLLSCRWDTWQLRTSPGGSGSRGGFGPPYWKAAHRPCWRYRTSYPGGPVRTRGGPGPCVLVLSVFPLGHVASPDLSQAGSRSAAVGLLTWVRPPEVRVLRSLASIARQSCGIRLWLLNNYVALNPYAVIAGTPFAGYRQWPLGPSRVRW
jgi:hypothetical protein